MFRRFSPFFLAAADAELRHRSPFARAACAVGRALVGLPKRHLDGAALKVWVPACGDGESVYGTAAALKEILARRRIKLRVIGSDADPGLLERARRALLPPAALPPSSAAHCRKKLALRPDGWRVLAPLRACCLFWEHDLVCEAGPPAMDLVLLLDGARVPEPYRAAAGVSAWASLKPGGLLVAGSDFRTALPADGFRPLGGDAGLFLKRAEAAGLPMESVEQAAHRARGPYGRRGGVLLDGQLQLVQALPGAGTFFVAGLAAGGAALSLARPSLRAPLETLFARAASGESGATLMQRVAFSDLGDVEHLILRVLPFKSPEGRAFFWVVFDLEREAKSGAGDDPSISEALRESTSRLSDTVGLFRLLMSRTRDGVVAVDGDTARVTPLPRKRP